MVRLGWKSLRLLILYLLSLTLGHNDDYLSLISSAHTFHYTNDGGSHTMPDMCSVKVSCYVPIRGFVRSKFSALEESRRAFSNR